jgi:hypothetical protein
MTRNAIMWKAIPTARASRSSPRTWVLAWHWWAHAVNRVAPTGLNQSCDEPPNWLQIQRLALRFLLHNNVQQLTQAHTLRILHIKRAAMSITCTGILRFFTVAHVCHIMRFNLVIPRIPQVALI